MNMKNIKSNQKGQALLFVVITMTIALALGIGLSLETINTVSNVADTDTSQRALAAAEGAAERALTLDDAQLKLLKDNMDASNCEDPDYLGGSWDAARSLCFVDFIDSEDNVSVRASVEVTDYSVVFEDQHSSPISIGQNQVKEIFLEGFLPAGDSDGTIDVCWDGPAVLYYRVFNEAGDTKNNIVQCSGVPNPNCSSFGWSYGATESADPGSAFADAAKAEYDNCYSVSTLGPNGVSDPKGLRLRALGAPITNGMIFPTPQLPTQGYKIHAVGELLNPDGTQRSVTVYKSFSFVPTVFDFSFYSKDNLSL